MADTTSHPAGRHVLVDAHVHLHPGVEIAVWLSRARAGFDLERAGDAVLMLAESAGVDRFAELLAAAGASVGSGWSVRATDESTSLEASGPGRIFVVAGRQIATREGLEVLALNTRSAPADGGGFEAVLDEVIASGAIPVIPWGFGKWWLSRRQYVKRTISTRDAGKIFLGDNAGRPRGLPPSKLFLQAASRGVRILPGSDPLPFASEINKVARTGFKLPGMIDPRTPATWVVDRIRALPTSPAVYGSFEGWLDFVKLQTAMQLRRLRRGGTR